MRLVLCVAWVNVLICVKINTVEITMKSFPVILTVNPPVSLGVRKARTKSAPPIVIGMHI